MQKDGPDIARIAALGRPDEDALQRILGDRRTERFGRAFLDVLAA